MITHGVIGGLGNQLYQIFTTIALAMRTGQACVFHRKAEFNVPTNTVRAMHWDTLFSALDPYLRDTDPLGDVVNRANSEFAEGGVYLYREPGHPYTPIELPTLVPSRDTSKTLYILEGYFQSYKYFDAEFETICTFLRLEEQQARAIDRCRGIPDLQPLVDGYDARRSGGGGTQNAAITVAMHFRFGDYKTVSYNHSLLTAAYYDRAMAALLAQTWGENPDTVVHVYLFYNTGDEDDVGPIVAQLKTKYESPNVQFHPLPPTVLKNRLTDPEHLLIMSACSHFILANSTYSLWASYFAGYFTRLGTESSAFAANVAVWYPSVWFGPGLADKQVHDMFPKAPGWTKVDA
jgi:hypothetical protein